MALSVLPEPTSHSHIRDMGIGGCITPKWIFKKMGVKVETTLN
jgi:hypothetical protein